jgi:hypothetical protein
MVVIASAPSKITLEILLGRSDCTSGGEVLHINHP